MTRQRPAEESALIACLRALTGEASGRGDELGRAVRLADPHALVSRAAECRIGGLLYWSVSSSCESALPGGALERLRTNYDDASRRQGRFADELQRLRPVFAAQRLPVVPLKGHVFAHQYYPRPGARESCDLDLLVPPESFDSAVRLLTQAGYTRPRAADYQSPWVKRLIEQYGHGPKVTLLNDRNHCQVELHTSLGMAAASRARALWQRLRSISVRGEVVSALGPTDLLYHACVHISEHLHEGRSPLCWLADIACLWARARDEIDWPLLDQLLRRSQGRGPAAVLSLAAEVLGLPVPITGPLPGPREDLRHIDLLRPSVRLNVYLRQQWRLLAAGPPMLAVASALSLVFPSRDWLRAEYGPRAESLRGYWLVHLSRLARRLAHLSGRRGWQAAAESLDAGASPSARARPALDLIRAGRRGALNILLHPSQPRWLVLNDSALEIADLFDGRRTIADAAGRLTERYALSREQAEASTREVAAELESAGFLAQTVRKPESPQHVKRVTFNLTRRCNRSCAYCSLDGRPQAASDTLSPGTVTRFVTELSDAKNGGHGPSLEVALTGGEPLTLSEWQDYVVCLAGHALTIATNGALLDRDAAALLAEHQVAVQLSLDDTEAARHDALRGTGSHRAALAALELLLARGMGPRVTLACVVTKQNVSSAPGLIPYAARRGIAGVRFLPVMRNGRAAETYHTLAPTRPDLAEFYRTVIRARHEHPDVLVSGLPGLAICCGSDEEPWCPVSSSLAVETDGRVFVCPNLMHSSLSLGNVHQDSASKIARSRRRAEVVRSIHTRVSGLADCRDCEWRNFCQAGCAALAFWQTGALSAPDGLCSIRKELLPEQIWEEVARDTGTVDDT